MSGSWDGGGAGGVGPVIDVGMTRNSAGTRLKVCESWMNLAYSEVSACRDRYSKFLKRNYDREDNQLHSAQRLRGGGNKHEQISGTSDERARRNVDGRFGVSTFWVRSVNLVGKNDDNIARIPRGKDARRGLRG